MADFRGRVLTTRERVKFAHADPYGHLASGAYVDMIMSHRVEALQDLLGFSIVRSAADGVAFPARTVEVTFLRPSLVGDELQVASWVDDMGVSSFEVRALVCGAKDRKARALARVHFVTVDARTGRSVPVPAALSSSFDTNALITLPTTVDYLASVTGIPDDWRPTAA
jgi:YbgC/YbaW family acyl-CoA thioester hydrolase